MSTSLQSRSTHLRRRTENEDRRSAPRTSPGSRDGRARRLAEATRDRLGWLHGTPASRLTPLLGRFARQGWGPADIALVTADVLGVRGHRVPRELRHPAAYLADLLRDVDHETERPSVERARHEAHLKAQAAAERAGRRAQVLALAGKCAHGVAAHGAGQPARGVDPCAQGCRP